MVDAAYFLEAALNIAENTLRRDSDPDELIMTGANESRVAERLSASTSARKRRLIASLLAVSKAFSLENLGHAFFQSSEAGLGLFGIGQMQVVFAPTAWSQRLERLPRARTIARRTSARDLFGEPEDDG